MTNESSEVEATKMIKKAMDRRIDEFKVQFKDFVNEFDRVLFDRKVKNAIKMEGIKLRRMALTKYSEDVKSMSITDYAKDDIGYEYEKQMGMLMDSVISYSGWCTTGKELLTVVTTLAAMLAVGYAFIWFVATFGVEATVAGLSVIMSYFEQRSQLA